jgi:UDP-glucose 4-epimerase
MTTVAIAGATGLIGHAVARALEATGRRVLRIGRGAGCDVAFDLSMPGELDAAALGGCEALVHAAGVTDEDFARPEVAQAKAGPGARALFRAAERAGVPRIAYISSAHVYGPLEGEIDEATPLRPVSPYARAHHATEEAAREAASRTGAALLLSRPCAVYGMPPSLATFARWSLIPFDFPRQAVQGEIVLKSAGQQRRNFVAAEGVANLVGWWLERDGSGETIANAPGPAEMSVHDFARMCARLALDVTGREPAISRPATATAPAHAPFHYRTRVTGHLPGPALEDHVRALMRALSPEGRS